MRYIETTKTLRENKGQFWDCLLKEFRAVTMAMLTTPGLMSYYKVKSGETKYFYYWDVLMDYYTEQFLHFKHQAGAHTSLPVSFLPSRTHSSQHTILENKCIREGAVFTGNVSF